MVGLLTWEVVWDGRFYDGRFSGFGGFVLVRNGEDGFGGTKSRGVDRVGWENFVMEWGVKR